MSYHNHLVSMPYQSLRQGIYVILHSPKARVKEVTNECNAVRHYMYYYVVLVVSAEACGVLSSGASSGEQHRAAGQASGIGHAMHGGHRAEKIAADLRTCCTSMYVRFRSVLRMMAGRREKTRTQQRVEEAIPVGYGHLQVDPCPEGHVILIVATSYEIP